jgi:hypothetical protein
MKYNWHVTIIFKFHTEPPTLITKDTLIKLTAVLITGLPLN